MEEFDTTTGESVEALQKFTAWVEDFCTEAGIVSYKNSDEYESILDLRHEDILGMSSDECFANAIILMNYVGFLQKKLDMIQSQLNWCVEALTYLSAKYWDRYDKYLPADVKRKSIIIENTYAQSIEKSRLRLCAGSQVLSETCKDIKKRVSLFQDLGKTRNFK